MQQREASVLIKQEGCLQRLGGHSRGWGLREQAEVLLPARGGGVWHQLRQPRGKGRIPELESETWAGILAVQRTSDWPDGSKFWSLSFFMCKIGTTAISQACV